MPPTETKARILDAAEALFAERGFEAPMRSITSRAEVNLAAVHYHFGCKEALVRAVLERRIGPINRERLERLDALEARHAPEAVPLRAMIEAFVGPPLRLPACCGSPVMRLLGHTLSLPEGPIRTVISEQFQEVVERFTTAIGRSLPRLPPRDVYWRFLFMVGAMAHSMALSRELERMSKGLCDARDPEATIRRLVEFVASGFDAEPADA